MGEKKEMTTKFMLGGMQSQNASLGKSYEPELGKRGRRNGGEVSSISSP